jgi:Arc/MetJ-type ribon-helix-helix transcriptional regulator
MTTRITVSLPDDLAAAVQEMAEQHRTPSVSAFVAEAVADRLTRRERARQWLDEQLAEARARDPEGFDKTRTRVREVMAQARAGR